MPKWRNFAKSGHTGQEVKAKSFWKKRAKREIATLDLKWKKVSCVMMAKGRKEGKLVRSFRKKRDRIPNDEVVVLFTFFHSQNLFRNSVKTFREKVPISKKINWNGAAAEMAKVWRRFAKFWFLNLNIISIWGTYLFAANVFYNDHR